MSKKSGSPKTNSFCNRILDNINQTPALMLIFAAFVLLVSVIFIFSSGILLLNGTIPADAITISKLIISFVGFYGALKLAVRKKIGAILVGIYLAVGLAIVSVFYYAIAIGLFSGIVFTFRKKLE